jgi:hypothetical protein
MKLGFTGTRHGMTERQRFAVSEFLDQHKPSETHSGDCRGADSEFLDAALLCAGNDPPRTHGHPGNVEKWRAGRKYDHLHPVKECVRRNQDIVDACDELLATPKTMKSERYSGTWQTINKAIKARKNLTIIWPDGSLQRQGYASLAEIFGVTPTPAVE